MKLPAPRTIDEVRAAVAVMEASNLREAHADSIVALTPAHRFLSPGPMTVTWTNARGLWHLTLDYRDLGYRPIIHVTMPLLGTPIPLPDHDVDYVRAMLVILGGIDAVEEVPG